jgi:hypothetical protein
VVCMVAAPPIPSVGDTVIATVAPAIGGLTLTAAHSSVVCPPKSIEAVARVPGAEGDGGATSGAQATTTRTAHTRRTMRNVAPWRPRQAFIVDTVSESISVAGS